MVLMLISYVFIDVAAKLTAIYFSNPGDCPVEVAMIAFANQFVQYEIDLNNPKMIREFIDFFRETLAEYAPRYYCNERKREFTNANVGEFHDRLDVHNLPLCANVTGFGTRPCLTKGDAKSVNHVHRDNHSIGYLLRTILTDAFRSMTNRNITPASIDNILKAVAVADIHTRCGTKGQGNKFPVFRDEVDDDPEMSAFCSRYETDLELDEEIDIGNKKYTHCKPIIIDMLLGLFNLVLFALYYYAVTKTALCVFISSYRALVCFETVGGNIFNALVSKVVVIGKGLHPNAVETNLTNKGRYQRPLEDVRLMDEGLALFLQRFHGRTINFINDNGLEQSGQIVWGPVDSLQRVYNYRLSKKNQDELERRKKELERRRKELESMNNKMMAELKRKRKQLERKHRELERKHRQLERKQGQLERKREKLSSLNEKISKTHAKKDEFEQKKAAAVAKRKEDKALQDNEKAVEANKRAKKQTSAFALLSSLSSLPNLN